jgi:hypothetical protein
MTLIDVFYLGVFVAFVALLFMYPSIVLPLTILVLALQ